MISRHWKGIARPGQAEWYVDHLRRDIFPKLAAIPGFVRATILRREVADGTEFQIVTVWQSLSAVQTFAGKDPEVAVVPPVVQAMMASYDRDVVHYELGDTYEPVARAQ
jgi:heme-degrading monooxygenase HmoA